MKQLITSVFLLASFLFSGTISAQTQQEKDIKRLIIGTWEGTISIEVDEEGNKVEIPKLRSFGSEENHNNEEQDKNDLAFNFNSAFEGRELFEGEPIHYAFIYDVSADTLLLGSQKWKVVKIDNNELQLLEIPELIPLRGYKLMSFKKTSSKGFESTRYELLEGIKGEWVTKSVQPVRTEGIAIYEEPVTILDTLSAPITDPVFSLSFSNNELVIGQDEIGPMGTFKYDVADSMINSDGIHLFSIFEIKPESLTLLGIHGTETQGKPLMIWKLERKKSN